MTGSTVPRPTRGSLKRQEESKLPYSPPRGPPRLTSPPTNTTVQPGQDRLLIPVAEANRHKPAGNNLHRATAAREVQPRFNVQVTPKVIPPRLTVSPNRVRSTSDPGARIQEMRGPLLRMSTNAATRYPPQQVTATRQHLREHQEPVVTPHRRDPILLVIPLLHDPVPITLFLHGPVQITPLLPAAVADPTRLPPAVAKTILLLHAQEEAAVQHLPVEAAAVAVVAAGNSQVFPDYNSKRLIHEKNHPHRPAFRRNQPSHGSNRGRCTPLLQGILQRHCSL